MGYRVVKKAYNIMFSRFDTIPACDGQTDGQTDVQAIAKTCVSSRNNMTVQAFDLDDPMTHPSGPLLQF